MTEVIQGQYDQEELKAEEEEGQETTDYSDSEGETIDKSPLFAAEAEDVDKKNDDPVDSITEVQGQYHPLQEELKAEEAEDGQETTDYSDSEEETIIDKSPNIAAEEDVNKMIDSPMDMTECHPHQEELKAEEEEGQETTDYSDSEVESIFNDVENNLPQLFATEDVNNKIDGPWPFILPCIDLVLSDQILAPKGSDQLHLIIFQDSVKIDFKTDSEESSFSYDIPKQSIIKYRYMGVRVLPYFYIDADWNIESFKLIIDLKEMLDKMGLVTMPLIDTATEDWSDWCKCLRFCVEPLDEAKLEQLRIAVDFKLESEIFVSPGSPSTILFVKPKKETFEFKVTRMIMGTLAYDDDRLRIIIEVEDSFEGPPKPKIYFTLNSKRKNMNIQLDFDEKNKYFLSTSRVRGWVMFIRPHDDWIVKKFEEQLKLKDLNKDFAPTLRDPSKWYIALYATSRTPKGREKDFEKIKALFGENLTVANTILIKNPDKVTRKAKKSNRIFKTPD